MRIGIIGSTGIKIELFTDNFRFESVAVGSKEFRFHHGYIGDREIILTARNQYNGAVPPHKVDYGLIMQGMKALGVDTVVGTAAAGSLSADIEPGSYLVLDQFIDFTRSSPHNSFDSDRFAFVDFAEPYCPETRKALIRACTDCGVSFRPQGCYVGADGPRFETSAEVRMYRMLGGDVVGMTNVTETIFAREAGMCYGALCLVVNYGAGIDARKEVLRQDCYDRTMASLDHTIDILRRFIEIFPESRSCDCHTKNGDIL